MSRLLLIGEPLFRISPSQFQSFSNACQTQLYFGGAEVNIARTLGGFGEPTKFLTALPENALGYMFENFLRNSQVDTSQIAWQGKRVGLYYLENGFGCRSSQVYYDRSGTSFSEMTVDNINLEHIFDGITHFHFSGISLVLGQNSRDVIEYLLTEARKRHICISFDLNFRSSMISVREAKEIFSHFAFYADIIFGMEPLMLNDADFGMFDRAQADISDIEQRLSGLYHRYHLQAIFHTERRIAADGNNYFKAYAYNGKLKKSLEIGTAVLQRVGSGDAFVAGLLYKLMQGNDIEMCLDFAVATASLKCTVADDQLFVATRQVEELLKNNCDVQR